mmetsp:Transcript_12758/g.25006  ORF Transcript_12758/g.25006 Transcript_12758/m.25006 type:complete len:207 (-) Transcript_12758:839-1459(-)
MPPPSPGSSSRRWLSSATSSLRGSATACHESDVTHRKAPEHKHTSCQPQKVLGVASFREPVKLTFLRWWNSTMPDSHSWSRIIGRSSGVFACQELTFAARFVLLAKVAMVSMCSKDTASTPINSISLVTGAVCAQPESWARRMHRHSPFAVACSTALASQKRRSQSGLWLKLKPWQTFAVRFGSSNPDGNVELLDLNSSKIAETLF